MKAEPLRCIQKRGTGVLRTLEFFMGRKLQLVLLLLLVAGTTESGIRASTDCERWMAAYKTNLAHAKAVRRMQAAHERVKHMAQRKLANYVKKPSAPKPVQAHFVRPKYTRQQILDRFNILCGDLPGMNKPADQLMEGKMTPVEFASEMKPFVPMEFEGTDDGGLIASGDAPPTYQPPAVGIGGNGPFSGGPGGFGGPPIYGGGPGGGGTTTSVPPIPPISEVPEPESIVMVLTGLVGVAGAGRRRMLR